MEFIVNNLPIIIFALIGIGLLIVEMFMPGFGIPGIAGIILLIAAVVFTWVEYGKIAGLGMALVMLAVAGLAIVLSLRSATKGRLSRSSLILKGALTREEGYVSQKEQTDYVGRIGTAVTVLRPSGIAEFGGKRLNVVTSGDYLQPGTQVVVKEVEGPRILVEEAI
jgi:membrane-bound ClpP family serine protease